MSDTVASRGSLLSGLLAGAVLLVACGGGTSGAATPQPTANVAPTFTSPASHSTPENSQATGYIATAADANGDALSFAISGGMDAARFNLDPASGALSFAAAPDFEAPNDADANNVYTVELSVSDGRGGRDSQVVNVSVTDVAESNSVRYRDVVFSGVDVQSGVVYGQADAVPGTQTANPVTLRMDIYTPAGDTAGQRPVLVFAFGGGFVGGSRTNDNVVEIARDFARRGYVVAAPDYRILGSPPANNDELLVEMMRATHDIKAAIRFFREDAATRNTYRIDGNAVFVGGLSSGAVAAIVAGTLDAGDTLQPVLSTYLSANGGLEGESSTNLQFSSAVRGIFAVSGGIVRLDWIDPASVPLYAAHEEFDTVVPCQTGQSSSFSNVTLSISGSCDMVPAFQAAGHAAQLYLALGATTHTKYSSAQRAQIRDEAAAFLFAHLP